MQGNIHVNVDYNTNTIETAVDERWKLSNHHAQIYKKITESKWIHVGDVLHLKSNFVSPEKAKFITNILAGVLNSFVLEKICKTNEFPNVKQNVIR